LPRHAAAKIRELPMNIQERAKNMVVQPAREWPVVAAEQTDAATLIREYAAPLAAIPAVCGFIGLSIVGMSVPFAGYVRAPFVRGLAGAIVSWVLTLVGVYVAATVVEKLAPKFQSSGGTINALKLIVYAATPVWVAGVFNLIPSFGVLTILAGLYAIYVFYLGLPVLMSTPADQVLPFMVVSAVVTLIVWILLSVVVGAISGINYGLPLG
jgi:hypothetical protein